MVKKQSRGRQKIEMMRMTKYSNLQVTFSKRRAGLFKKASELCTLCGAEIAMVVLSPGDKVFSFGHPEVDALIHRYFSRNPPQTSGTLQLVEAHRNAIVRELNMQLTEVLSRLEAEKRRGEGLSAVRNVARQSQCWWQSPVEELSLPQLFQLKYAMEELKKDLAKHVQDMNSQQFFMASSSTGMLPYEMNNANNNITPDQHMIHPPDFNPNQAGYDPSSPMGCNPGFGHGFLGWQS